MKIVCDACSAKYSIADEKVRGKVFKIRCKKCSNIIVVRGSAGEGGAEAPAGQPFEKETKVFDYSGYDNPADAAAAGADDQVWHLVIDQEQIGPMTVAEVKERFDRGEIDADSYVWREGFGDWERLADVDAFAGVVNGAGGGATAGLFGGDDGRTVQSDPADLFAAHGGDDDGGGGASSDLFAGGGMAAAAATASAGDDDEGGLFGSAGGMAAAAAPAKAAKSAAPMTGQRNENSVLFSLNNLAALASDSPRAAASSSSSSSSASSSSSGSASLASGSSAGMAQGEGSGLIDIRSMAQVYLGDSPAKPAASKPGIGSADDLPVFSQTSFESASPVLLPTAQPAVNNRLLFALVGLIGVLVIAAVVLVIVVLKGGGDKDGTKVAAADTQGDDDKNDKDKPDTTATQPAATPPAGGETPAATPATGGETPAATPVADKGGTVGKKAEDKDKGSKHSSKSSSSSSSSSSSKPVEKPVEKKPAADPLASSGCDEVTCLVEPDKPCCRGKGGSKKSSSSSSKSADPSLPERPSRSDVSGGMSAVKGRVSSCGSKHGGKGTVMVKIKISPSGGVSSASASGGNSGLASCVESAVRGAHFPKSQLGITVNYPFVF